MSASGDLRLNSGIHGHWVGRESPEWDTHLRGDSERPDPGASSPVRTGSHGPMDAERSEAPNPAQPLDLRDATIERVRRHRAA